MQEKEQFNLIIPIRNKNIFVTKKTGIESRWLQEIAAIAGTLQSFISVIVCVQNVNKVHLGYFYSWVMFGLCLSKLINVDSSKLLEFF